MIHATPAPRRPANLTIRAWFDEPTAAMVVRNRLVERGYPTQVLTSASGQVLMTVTTPVVLRAEVEGLIWLGGGSVR